MNAKSVEKNQIQKMSLEEYRQKVTECQAKSFPNTEAENERLINLYWNDFQELLEWNFTPEQAVGTIRSGLY